MRRGRRRAALLLVASLWLSTAACTSGDSDPETSTASGQGCSTSEEPDAGASVEKVEDRGTDREYAINIPPSYRPGTKTPVVVLFHGGGQVAKDFMKNSGFQDESDRRGFILVAPQALGDKRLFDFLSASDEKVSDLPMVDTVLDRVESDLCVDTRSVYAAGFSVGSAMVFALSCESDTRFAAFGGSSGIVLKPSCEKAPPISVIYFHGTKDETIPFDGLTSSELDGRVPGLSSLPDVRQAVAAVAAHDSCEATPRQTAVAPDIAQFSWSTCDAGTAVEAYVIDGGGHQWPGVDPVSTSPDNGKIAEDLPAASLMWKFFSNRTLATAEAVG